MKIEQLFFIVTAVYFLSVNLAAVLLTITDKKRSKKKKMRIPEKTLFLIALAGGAAAMYLTMRIIHHKTLHKRFMIGLPAIILIHTAIAVIILMHTAGA